MLTVAILIVILGLLFDYTNGFHDAANVVSTVIATHVLGRTGALLMAATLNTLGATQISGVAQTIATGLVEIQETNQGVVLCAVCGAIVWNLATWYKGIPSSSSYALIGGLLGAAWMHKGIHTILWNGVFYKVLIPMIAAPIIGFSIAFFTMQGLYAYVGKRPHLKERAIFGHLQLGSSCALVLAHGLNDAQKSMGIITLGLFISGYLATPEIPLWVILSCALIMGLGTVSGGFRVIRTMGFSITKIDTVQGFAAESSASGVILIASLFGIPLSSTHMIAGCITGVGSARSLRSVYWNIPEKIILTWFLTLPGAGAVGALVYLMTKVVGLNWY